MARKMKGSAFHFGKVSEAGGYTLGDYLTWLRERNGTANWPTYARVDAAFEDVIQKVWIEFNTDIVVGVIVSADQHRHELYEVEENGHTIIRQRRIDGRPPVEINLFAMRLDSRNGLYAHARKSFPFRHFMVALNRSYRQFLRESGSPSERALAINEEDITTPLFNREGFDRLVQGLTNVDLLTVSAPTPLTPDGAPHAPFISSSSHTYRMREVNGSRAARFLSFMRGYSVDGRAAKKARGSVHGRDAENHPITIRFENTMDDYLEIDYSTVTDVDTTQIMQHPVVRNMARIIRAQPLFDMR